MSTRERDRTEAALLPMWWMACAMVPVVVRLLSTGVIENGDGVQHYQIAHYSWDHPELFLHHWGKPLFTLLSSPFAQLGHWGMTLFNAICFLLTCWAADGLLRQAGRAASWLFAPTLLLIPVYGTMVLGGMTEVLFALLAMLVVKALHERHHAWAMTIVSFLPFARPEYIGFAPFAIAWVLKERRWKALPFLLIGHVVYGIIGDIVLGDPLWAFHQDPYTGAQSIYGKGDLFHFTDHIQDIFGYPLIWAVGFAVLAACVITFLQREDRPKLGFLLWMALLPTLAILAIHSILWWKGLKGSLGLFRVLATTGPLVVLCTWWPLVRAGTLLLKTPIARSITTALVGVGFVILAATEFLRVRPLPAQPDAYERFVDRVGNEVGVLKKHYARVVYFHPYIAYAAGIDPYDQGKSLNGMDPTREDLGLHEKDLVVWDAHFGPNEGGIPVDRLLADPELELLRVMAPDERLEVLGGHPFEAFLFTRNHKERRRDAELVFAQTGTHGTIPFTADTTTCPPAKPGAWCFDAAEFPFGMGPIPLERPDLVFSELLVTGTVEWSTDKSGQLELVFEEENGTERISYWSQSLKAGAFEVRYRIPRRDAGVRNKLYLWDPQGIPFRLSDFKVEVVHIQRQGG